jgi:hypothetical protein
MNRKKSVKYIDVLILAKRYLSKTGREDNRYVCIAVVDAAYELGVSAMGNELRSKIMGALTKDDRWVQTVRLWLMNQGVPCKELTNKAMQQYRHRWLNHLIKQFKAAGK